MLFNNLKLESCGRNVYLPREDSFIMAEAVEKLAFKKTLDMGTGTGILGLTACANGCEVTFADIDKNALDCARRNSALNSFTGEFIETDLFSNISQKFNTIIFNPPYLPSEPLGSLNQREYALDGGKQGRELIDAFLSQYKNYVEKEHVVIMLESSFNNYEEDVKNLNADIFKANHYFFEDLAVLVFQ